MSKQAGQVIPEEVARVLNDTHRPKPPPSSEVGLLPMASPYIICLLEGHNHKATHLLWP